MRRTVPFGYAIVLSCLTACQRTMTCIATRTVTIGGIMDRPTEKGRCITIAGGSVVMRLRMKNGKRDRRAQCQTLHSAPRVSATSAIHACARRRLPVPTKAGRIFSTEPPEGLEGAGKAHAREGARMRRIRHCVAIARLAKRAR